VYLKVCSTLEGSVVSSIPSPSDKYLKSEVEPQRLGIEGTVDRLNEAQRLLCRKDQALEYCEALIEFANHMPACPLRLHDVFEVGYTCDCGLDALIEKTRLTFDGRPG